MDNEDPLHLLLTATLIAIIHGIIYFIVVGHYIFVYLPAKNLKKPLADAGLESFEASFGGLSEKEKKARVITTQRKQFLMDFCQRFFVAFIGADTKWVSPKISPNNHD
jgi:hypothetical protein